MCRLSVSWHGCDHLASSDSSSPYHDAFKQHHNCGKTFTHNASDKCLFSIQPESTGLDAMKGNQSMSKQMKNALKMKKRSGVEKFKETISDFFTKSLHRSHGQSDPQADNAKKALDGMMKELHRKILEETFEKDEDGFRAARAPSAPAPFSNDKSSKKNSSNEATHEESDDDPDAHEDITDVQEEGPSTSASKPPTSQGPAKRAVIPDNVSIYSISSSSPSPEDPPHPPEDDPIMEENLVKAFDKFFQKKGNLYQDQSYQVVEVPTQCSQGQNGRLNQLQFQNGQAHPAQSNVPAQNNEQRTQRQNSPKSPRGQNAAQRRERKTQKRIQNGLLQGPQPQNAPVQNQVPNQNFQLPQAQNGYVQGGQLQNAPQMPAAHGSQPGHNGQMPAQVQQTTQAPHGKIVESLYVPVEPNVPNAPVQYRPILRCGEIEVSVPPTEEEASQLFYRLLVVGLIPTPKRTMSDAMAARLLNGMLAKGQVTLPGLLQDDRLFQDFDAKSPAQSACAQQPVQAPIQATAQAQPAQTYQSQAPVAQASIQPPTQGRPAQSARAQQPVQAPIQAPAQAQPAQTHQSQVPVAQASIQPPTQASSAQVPRTQAPPVRTSPQVQQRLIQPSQPGHNTQVQAPVQPGYNVQTQTPTHPGCNAQAQARLQSGNNVQSQGSQSQGPQAKPTNTPTPQQPPSQQGIPQQFVQPQEVELQPNNPVDDDRIFDLVNFDNTSPTPPLSMNATTSLPDYNTLPSQAMQDVPSEFDSPLFDGINLTPAEIDQIMQPPQVPGMVQTAMDQTNFYGSDLSGVTLDDFQHITTSGPAKNKGKSRRRKSKSSPTASYVIIDKTKNDTNSQRSGSGHSSPQSVSSGSSPSSDPTRGVRDPNSRVIKSYSPSKSSKRLPQASTPGPAPIPDLSNLPTPPLPQQTLNIDEPGLGSDNPLDNNPFGFDFNTLLDDESLDMMGMGMDSESFFQQFSLPLDSNGNPLSPSMPPPSL